MKTHGYTEHQSDFLAADSGERHNLFQSRPAIVEELTRLLPQDGGSESTTP